MSYRYCDEKPALFTEAGQEMFLKIRDRTQQLLQIAGAARMQEIIDGFVGDCWVMLACVDRMIELGELLEITSEDCPGQHRVFVCGVLGRRVWK